MNSNILAALLILPLSILIWEQKIHKNNRSLVHGFLVFIAAIVVSSQYLEFRRSINSEPDFLDKFWISLPILTSFVITDRCILGRIFRFVIFQKINRKLD